MEMHNALCTDIITIKIFLQNMDNKFHINLNGHVFQWFCTLQGDIYMLTPHIDINHSSQKEFHPTWHQYSPSCTNVTFIVYIYF